MLEEQYDTIIVGTGAAGLFTALHLPKNSQILMISKDTITNSDSYLAQGGISCLNGEEDYQSYFDDTLRAGRYENNKESVKTMILESMGIIEELKELGVDFDQDQEGKISYTREGGHSIFRILHHKDETGKEIVTKLLAQVEKQKHITLLEHSRMVDIICKDNCCYGIIVKKNGEESRIVFAKEVILATGGLGGLFKNSTNFSHIEGDSFALALQHNIKLENLHYIQIHPTVLYSQKSGRRFLISESVRGEGAVLYNKDGDRFVDELLPRDVVAKAIHDQMKKDKKDHVYLSFENISEEKLQNHFPNIYQTCLEEGYDLKKDWIPVTPAQHYLMGGIYTDIYGQTSMKNLYAVGETACNGVHGANRLASNSLLESLVFAKNAAQVVCDNYKKENNIKEFFTQHMVKEVKNYYNNRKPYLENIEEFGEVSRKQVLDKIRKEDKDFYDQWCDI